MLETIALVLIILWLAGLVSSYTMGGFILFSWSSPSWWCWFVSFRDVSHWAEPDTATTALK